MYEVFGLTDPGCVRQNNEDFFLTDPEAGIFILADGMGGANAGEHASRLSAETLYQYLQNPHECEKDGLSLSQGFNATNTVVRQAAQSDPNLAGMGTTLLAVRGCHGGSLDVCNVGDCRAYLKSGGKIAQITKDQTWVAEIGTHLGLSEEALRHHPMRHVLTMAVGAAESLVIQQQQVAFAKSDQILLCSDGLHGVVDENILSDVLNSEKSLPDKCHYLVEAAKKRGGPDNITVVLIQHL